MARIVAPDGCIGMDVNTEYGREASYNGPIFETDNARHIRLLTSQGAFIGSVGGVPKAAGYWCAHCARTSYFIRCSKCGRENPREEK